MTVKAIALELKRFFEDTKYWAEETYHDDTVFKLNGAPMPEEMDPSSAQDGDIITIENGYVVHSPLYADTQTPTLADYFKRWKREQTTISFVVTCDKSVQAEVEAAVKAAGGKLTK